MRHEAPPLAEGGPAGKRLVDREVSIEFMPAEAAGFTPDETVFPEGSSVFLTHIQGRPLEEQVDAASRLVEGGFRPVPHLGARNFASADEYAAHLKALAKVGVEEALFVGGNPARPTGSLKEAAELIAHPALRNTGIRTAYLAVHPEGHPSVAQATMDEALARKLALCREHGLAPVCVSQFGFDGEVIGDWARRFLSAHPKVPLRIGLAGVTSLPRLVGYARRCGVGPSVAALKGWPSRLMGLVTDRDPGDVIDVLERKGLARDPSVGLHFFAFGGWKKTLDWIARRRG